jgi:ParB family transcriptional regulator, chromosome partitioning protein
MAKRGLGRGLGALIPGMPSEEGIGPVSDLEVTILSPNPFQPRTEIAGPEFEELVNSIRRHGVLQPIVVRSGPDGGFEIVAGERRWRAAQAAGLARIPAVVREISDREMVELALVENLRREDLNPIERAHAFHRLIQDHRLTQEQIGEMVGGSRSAIANTVRLLDLPAEIQSAIAQGRLTEGHGRALLMVEDPARRLELWRAVEARGLSVRECEHLVKSQARHVSRETSHRSRSAADVQMGDLTLQLREKYATSVTIASKGKKGTIQLHYYSETDLERLIDMLLR